MSLIQIPCICVSGRINALIGHRCEVCLSRKLKTPEISKVQNLLTVFSFFIKGDSMKEPKFKRDNYIQIQGFMITDLRLKGNELLIYACIYGFSQKEDQVFTGGLSYLQEITLSTKQGIIKNLKSLESKNLIIKSEVEHNNIKTCTYTVNHETIHKTEPLNNVEYRSTMFNTVKQSLPTVKQSLPNNIYNNINNNNTLNLPKDKFNDIVCERQTVADNFIKPTIKNLSAVESFNKKSLIKNEKNDLLFRVKEKEIINRPRVRVNEPPTADKPTRELKRESYLRKALEIVSQTLKITDSEKLAIIKDWLFTLYDKGISSTASPRFKYMLDELQNTIKQFSWETVVKLIKDAIVSNHSTLKWVIQSRQNSRYNDKQRLRDEIKFPGMRDDETVDEYIARSGEIEQERQAALKELHDAKKNGTGKWY